MSLEPSFFIEGSLPRGKRRPIAIKDEIVSLLPNLPCCNDEEFHEEGVLKLGFSLLHHLEKISCEVPINSKVLPTSLAKGTAEEKMEGSFFNIVAAEDTVIYAALNGSFAGLGFLAWYLAGKLKAFDRKGHIAKLCLVFLPLLVASLVAVSRVDDYWHHWQDVFAGGTIGLTVASFCYLQFFPYPFDADAIWPHAYFQQLAETHSNGNANSYGTRPMEIEPVAEDHVAIVLGDTSPILDSMESGRRL